MKEKKKNKNKAGIDESRIYEAGTDKVGTIEAGTDEAGETGTCEQEHMKQE